MNFFEAQESARRKSTVAMILFVVAVVSLIVLLNVIIIGFISLYSAGHHHGWSAVVATFLRLPGVAMLTTFSVLLFIGLGCAIKYSSLSAGGNVIAEMLGGRIIPPNTDKPMERKILHVVEEMAIASGIPVPPVYLLEESSINAFAAGWSPGSAIIGITRGSMVYLNRDELQGVIAHEFSHIFNGDMRLNIRLVVLLHGLEVVSDMGKTVLSIPVVRVVEVISFIGMFLMFFGYLGVVCSDCIKAIVCRQREYLADASAVQYTRHTSGIAGALKKIGGLKSGSMLESPLAAKFSHGYFSSYSYFTDSTGTSLFSTHPPLQERIRRLEPRWDGKFIPPTQEMLKMIFALERPHKHSFEGDIIYVDDALNAVDQIGQTAQQNFKYAQSLFKEVPVKLRKDAKDPYSARALVYASLIQNYPDTDPTQWNVLQQNADPHVFTWTKELFPVLQGMPAKFRLPVYQLSMPALRTLSAVQYDVFRRNVEALIHTDRKVSFDEWVVQRFILQPLDEAYGMRKPGRIKYNNFDTIKPELELIISALTYIDNKNDSSAQYAFNLVADELGVKGLRPVWRDDVKIATLDQALDKLEQLTPQLKLCLLKALINSLKLENEITEAGYELVRALASCMGCPMPPIYLESKRSY